MIEVFFEARADGPALVVDSEVIARLPARMPFPSPAQSASIFEAWVNRGCQEMTPDEVDNHLRDKGLIQQVH